MTWSAPAASIFGMELSRAARETMVRPGFRERADSVTKIFSASVARAQMMLFARPMPAAAVHAALHGDADADRGTLGEESKPP